MAERRDAGFTLVELMLAMAISTIVVGGLAGIAAMAARSQARDYRHGTVATNLSYLMRYLQMDLTTARRVYGLDFGNLGATTVVPGAALCLATCNSGATNCTDAYAAVNTVTLTFVDYCYTQVTNSDGTKVGTVFRGTTTGTDNGVCPVFPACGAPMEQVAMYVDSMTFTQPVGFSDSVDVQLNGSWYSAASATTERIQLQSQVAWTQNNYNVPRGK